MNKFNSIQGKIDTNHVRPYATLVHQLHYLFKKSISKFKNWKKEDLKSAYIIFYIKVMSVARSDIK